MAKNSPLNNSSDFVLEVVSPEGILFEGPISQVVVPTENGEITILPHHVNLFARLGSGAVHVESARTEQSFAVMGGFVEVLGSTVRLISDFAIRADSISTAQAEEAKKRAERAKTDARENVDFVEIERDLQRSILQLHVADKVRRRSRT